MDLKFSDPIIWIFTGFAIASLLLAVVLLFLRVAEQRVRLRRMILANSIAPDSPQVNVWERMNKYDPGVPIEVMRPDGSTITVPLNPNNEESIRAFVERAKGGPIPAAG